MTSTLSKNPNHGGGLQDLRVEITDDLESDDGSSLAAQLGRPLSPLPYRLKVSGTYRRSTGLLHPIGLPLSPTEEPTDFTPNPEGPELPPGIPGTPPKMPLTPIPLTPNPRIPLPWQSTSEELRLDVDGRYPQMVVSGEVRRRVFGRCSWIAHVTPRAGGGWEGDITYKHGTASLMPFTHLEVTARPLVFGNGTATVTYSGPGATTSTRTYAFSASAFHDIEMEFDVTSDSSAVTSFDTASHPNRPASLPLETVTIEKVYARAGFRVSKSGGDSSIPVSAAGTDARWTDQEMHDAMQTYWSRFANIAQWSVWTLFAGQHIQGSSLGGIMFDDIGPQHRQGCSIFSNSFIATPPAGDPNGAAAVQRMRFWTAVHELGHTFNLAHAWQKALGAPYGNPWIPLANEPEARSFMNYPYNVAGGATAFFSTFAYRFSDDELLYLRHAPSQFVQHGNTAWFTDHGFEQAARSPEPQLALTVRLQRPTPVFEFLEPIIVEVTLKNITDQTLVIDKYTLESGSLSVLTVDRRGDANALRPFAQACRRPEQVALQPGESLYAALPLSASHGGAQLAEPGYHTIQACLHLTEEDLVSAPLRLKVSPPTDRAAEVLAPDLLEQDVRRVLAFGGSRVLTEANDVLQSVVEQLPGTAVATQAAFALARPLATTALTLQTPTTDPADMRIEAQPAEPAKAKQLLELVGQQGTADTLGHVGLHQQVSDIVERLAAEDHRPAAAKLQAALVETFESRGVKDTVLAEMRSVRDDLKSRKS